MTVVLLLVGLALLVVGAEFLVRGASGLAANLRVSPLVIGLTVVAFGTSAPELAVSVFAAVGGQPDISIGNVVGSNIFNVLFILGVSATIVPLAVSQRVVRVDVPVMIGVSIVLMLVGWNGRIVRWEGLLLLAGLLVNTIWCIAASRREQPRVIAEYEREFGVRHGSEPRHIPSIDPLAQRGRTSSRIVKDTVFVLLGLGLLVLGSRWLVTGAVSLAEWFGVSEIVIGLTIVAVGTSLPEVATSVLAAIRGERDIAVGNVIGSNIFNVLGVLGASAAIASDGIAVSERAWQFDMPVMTVAAMACLPVFFTGHLIARWEGILFLGYYFLYLSYLVLQATSAWAPPASTVLLFGIIAPLALISLAVVLLGASHRRSTSTQDACSNDDS